MKDTKPRKAQPCLLKEINVWRVVDDVTLIRYWCFQELPNGRYFVKGADHLHAPYDEKQKLDHATYKVDGLFYDGLLFSQREGSDDLEEAITKFDAEFNINFSRP